MCDVYVCLCVCVCVCVCVRVRVRLCVYGMHVISHHDESGEAGRWL